MMLLDANILLYAVDAHSAHNEPAAAWLSDVLNGDRRVGLPWQTIGGFIRISTHPRINESPLSTTEAWSYVKEWLACDPVWVPPATERTARVLAELMASSGPTGNLVPDAQLAALAIEHGLTVCSADTDFGRFPEVSRLNPLAP